MELHSKATESEALALRRNCMMLSVAAALELYDSEQV